MRWLDLMTWRQSEKIEIRLPQPKSLWIAPAAAISVALYAPHCIDADEGWHRRVPSPIFGDVLTSRPSDEPRKLHVPGFLEPYRAVELTTQEAGIVMDRPVAEGDTVAEGTVLYRLDAAVLNASLDIAKHEAARTSDLDSAKAELSVKERRLRSLEALAAAGHSGAEEMLRAKVDVELAAANVRRAKEQAESQSLEVRRIKSELDRRIVAAPIHGVVVELAVEPGESVGRTNEPVARIVQLDRLKATFYVPSRLVGALTVGDAIEIAVTPPAAAKSVRKATIEFVSPLIDAESGTVRATLVLDNPERSILSGSQCHLMLDDIEDDSITIGQRNDARPASTFAGVPGCRRIR